MTYRVTWLPCAIALVAVAACGTGGPGEPQASSTGTDSPAPTRSSAPTTATGPAQYEGVIEKKIGQPAALGCYDDPDRPCDLNFTVTAIQQDAPCRADAEQPGPDEQFLRFDIEAFSDLASFEYEDSAEALLLRNWSIGRPGGAVVDNLQSYPECGSGAAPISASVDPGPHVRARVVVRAPKPAATLRFSWQALVWEWEIVGTD